MKDLMSLVPLTDVYYANAMQGCVWKLNVLLKFLIKQLKELVNAIFTIKNDQITLNKNHKYYTQINFF